MFAELVVKSVRHRMRMIRRRMKRRTPAWTRGLLESPLCALLLLVVLALALGFAAAATTTGKGRARMARMIIHQTPVALVSLRAISRAQHTSDCLTAATHIEFGAQ